MKRRLTGHVSPFIGKYGNNARRWCISKAWLVGNGNDRFPLHICQCVCGARMYSGWSFIPLQQAVASFPPLQGPHVDAREAAGLLKPSAVGMGLLDVLSDFLAIFETDQSSAPSP